MGTRSFHRSSHERAFFVYNHQKHAEEDDPKDAILYFYPPSVDVTEQIALVGGIIGMVDFCMDLLQYTPSLISLTTCRFALLKAGPFILGLSSELQVPEQCVTQHLQYLWNTFCLFQGSLVAVQQRTGVDGFTLELDRIWNSYFSLCQSFSDQLSQAFGTIPYRELPLSQSGIFLEASHILQRAQHQAGVVGGVLLNKSRVLCTQLTRNITRRLLVLMPNEHNFPCIDIKPGFDLPAGVRLLCAFLTPEELSSLGPRRFAGSQRKKSHEQEVENKTTPSLVTTTAEPPSPPQQTQSAKSAYGLSAVIESVEIHEEDDGVGEDTEESESVFYNFTDPSQSLSDQVGDEHPPEAVANANSKESQSKSVCVSALPSSSHGDADADTEPVCNSFEKTETNPASLERNVKNCHDQAVIDETNQVSSQERTDSSSGEKIEETGEDKEQVIEMCNDSDVNSYRSRDSGDLSAAEDGGASTRRVGHNARGKNSPGVFSSSAVTKGVSDDQTKSPENSPQMNEFVDTVSQKETQEPPVLNSILKGSSLSYSKSKDLPNFTQQESGSFGSCKENESERDNAGEHVANDLISERQSGVCTVIPNAADAETEGPQSEAENAEVNREPDGGEMDSQSSLLQSAGTATADPRPRAEDDGNSHYIRSFSPIPEERSDSTVESVTVAESAIVSPVSGAASSSETPPPDNSLAGAPPEPDGCTSSVDELAASYSSAKGKRRHESGSGPAVPIDVELQLEVEPQPDLMRSGASSVLTVSDDLMSPSKERFSFDPTLLNSGSSGSGGVASSQGQTLVQPDYTRKYSTDPSSSDLTHSNENISCLSSSSALLSSPSAEAAGTGKGDDASLDGRQQVLLYVQGHMDTLLILLMDSLSHATKETVNILWKSSLAKLAELDYAVSDASGSKQGDAESGRSPYLYLKYNSSSQAMQGTAKSPVTSLANELVSSSVLLHDTFCKMPAAQDILCRTHTTCCYGHKSLSGETFFQVGARGGGSPDPRDLAFSLEQLADRKLYIDHSTTLM